MKDTKTSFDAKIFIDEPYIKIWNMNYKQESAYDILKSEYLQINVYFAFLDILRDHTNRERKIGFRLSRLS